MSALLYSKGLKMFVGCCYKNLTVYDLIVKIHKKTGIVNATETRSSKMKFLQNSVLQADIKKSVHLSELDDSISYFQ